MSEPSPEYPFVCPVCLGGGKVAKMTAPHIPTIQDAESRVFECPRCHGRGVVSAQERDAALRREARIAWVADHPGLAVLGVLAVVVFVIAIVSRISG